jgi:hypothetical protein
MTATDVTVVIELQAIDIGNGWVTNHLLAEIRPNGITFFAFFGNVCRLA